MKSILNRQQASCLRITTLIFILSLYSTGQAQFVPELFSSRCSGPKVKSILSGGGGYTNKIDSVTDDKFSQMNNGSWRNNFKHGSVYNRISISIKDTTKAMQKFDYLFNMTIDTFNFRQQKGTINLVMRFSYDPASHKAYIDKSVYQFRHCHKFRIKINSILDSALVNPASFSLSTMQTNFIIESEIIVERYYLISYDTAVATLSHAFIGKDKLRISWTPPSPSGPHQYELEWAYIDTAGINPDSVRYDFLHNSSRVLLSKTYYDINTVYDAGVIVYRLRRVIPDSVYFRYNKYSLWKPTGRPSKGFVVNYTANRVFVTSHEAMGKNWDYQVAFAEQGLKKEVVNYFDGSLKRRQGVTLSNTNNFSLVDESIYDHHGREVIKIIPAPSDSNTIRYYKKFNRNTAGNAYSALDFDSSTSMADNCNGNYKAKKVDTTSGAGRYYSIANKDKTNENAAIPDAQGYPLVQTKLMADPTGRVESQGGIGLVHQLGGGHETKYAYGSADQRELDRLFGSETGIASHYKKNAVTDPNGQKSISYIDQHGRVIATSLTGGVPGMVDTLDNFKIAKYEMTDLMPQVLMNNSLVVRHNFEVTTSGTHKIFYKLEAPDFTFGCLGLNSCYTCRYDLEISLNDACGNELLHFKRPIGRLYDTSCSPLVFNLEDSISSIIGTVSSNADSISFTLSTGKYNLVKILTVNTDSIMDKIDEVILADSGCYKTITDFIDAELETMDSSDCECLTCYADTLSYCESRRQLMLDDLMPGGQYFTYNEETFLVPDTPSILRDWADFWLYYYINPANFKDENGKPDTIWSSIGYQTPNELEPRDFVAYYKESWAEALLPLHPEYCYYQYCLDNLQPSYVYDEVMGEIDNYDTAEHYGYLNPLGNNSHYTELNNDPMFINADGSNRFTYTQFNSLLHNLDPYTTGVAADPLQTGEASVDLWQFAMAIGFCENISDSLQRYSCFKFYYQNQYTRNVWMNDQRGRDNYWQKFKTLYFQMKGKAIEDTMNKKTAPGKFCVQNIGSYRATNDPYHNKVSHFIRYKFQYGNPMKGYSQDSAFTKAGLLDSLEEFGMCEANVAHWDTALSLCANYNTHRDSILYFMLDVCRKGSTNPKFPNGMGTSDIPPPFSTGQRFKNFHEVLKYFIGSNYKTELCNIDLINSPKSYNADYENNKPVEADECICDRVAGEIGEFKGCYSKKDSLELSTEGLLVNDFINALVTHDLFNITAGIPLDIDGYPELISVADRLFAPVIGGSSASIQIMLKQEPVWLNERTFFVYNGNVSEGCKFSFRLNPNTEDFDNIDQTRKAVIKPLSQGVFSYKIPKDGGGWVDAFVYNTCFNNTGKCGPQLFHEDLPEFTEYFNKKHLTAFTEKEMEILLGQCGNGGTPNTITDKTNTYYLRYGSCPEYYRNYKEAKDDYLISFLNEMMRDPEYWTSSMPGWLSGDEEKRTLTTDASDFHCGSGKVDFLTQTRDYHLYKDFVHSIGDNYWWRYPTFSIGNLTIDGITRADTIWTNNYNSHPYFVGGFWIGANCTGDGQKDSACFTSFGDPLRQLGIGGRPAIDEIDSLRNYHWSEELSSYVVTAFDRSHPDDSVILTIKSKCKAECNPLVRYTEIPVTYKDVFIIPGSGGTARLSGVKADIGHNTQLINPFMDMLRGMGPKKEHAGTAPRNIEKYRPTGNNYFPGYYAALFPQAGAKYYRKEKVDDSIFIGRIGGHDAATDTLRCRFAFRQTGSDRSLEFDSIRLYRNFGPDLEAIAEAIKNDQLEMAGFHFTIEVGDINLSDTAWHTLKGWSSCWKFFEVTALSADGKALFDLPEDLVGNCNCMTCPETRRWSDSLYAEYPKLHPAHANYETIVTNYINRKLNTTLSFTEIQAHWDDCGVGRREFIPIPQCDYRLSVKNTDCEGHADTMLGIVMEQTERVFGYTYTTYSDSTEYCLDFSGYSVAEIKMLQDSLNKYFSSPYCNAFKKRINYRPGYDIILYNLDSANMESETCDREAFDTWFDQVKDELFGDNPDLVRTTVDNILHSEDNFLDEGNTTWLARIEFSDLDAEERTLFLDTLEEWTRLCGGFSITNLYYLPQLVTSTGDDDICLIGGGDTTCYSCDTIRRYIEDYQHDPLATAADLRPEKIEAFLRDKTGKPLQAWDGPSECVGCSNSSLYICEEPSLRLLKFVELLNKVAKNKKLNAPNYALNSSYTALLNALKPEGTVLNSPAYRYSANTKGGWSATIKYNTKTSDQIFVSSDSNDFFKLFNAGIDTFKQPRPIVRHGYVSTFSLNATDSLYNTFVYNIYIPGLTAYKCCGMPANLLCPRPYTREYDTYEPPCGEEEVLQAITNGTVLYEKYLDSIRHDQFLKYQLHCITNARESVKLGKFIQRYHTTLYYYDQAGNLIKTVPPAGVTELNLNALLDTGISRYRKNIDSSRRFVTTAHTLGTLYQYNSLNQLIWQKTPDGGESRFWYDRLGRLVLSQNAVQYARSGSQKIYSYICYDAFGRVNEVGEISNWQVSQDSLINYLSYYNNWLAGKKARTQITKTFYDTTAVLLAASTFSEGQRNLRGRVSTVAYYDGYVADSLQSTQYTRATHYSYDIHGNVDHLVHDFPDMAMVNSRFKHITYNYEPISGKVHAVNYQSGQADQWHHRYNYDADNRLTLAETSTDSIIWDRDAEYKYYKHGPLSRTLLGEHTVQGVDYAYTIHGWLKGVNSNTVDTSRDIGKDGMGVLRQYTARDAFGFTLGYYNDISGGVFDGDYKSIGTTGFEASTSNSPLAVTGSSMYNGNITHMVSAVRSLLSANSGSPLATIYKYDQLNRIKSVYTYNGINMSTNSWNSGSKQSAWKETFKYDANGNITKLVRYNKTIKIDSLTYNYTSGTNKLRNVDDAVAHATTTGDIDDQSIGNYKYDQIGNLVHDSLEQIDSIKWNVYGKITEIKRKTGSTRPHLSFRYDAMGQRVLKIVKPSFLETTWDYTWYVRDAQGNVMATYSKKNQISATDTSLYREINNSLITEMNKDSLAVLVKTYLGGTQFYTDLTNVLISRGKLDDWAAMYAADSLLTYEDDFAQDVLQNFCTYYSGADRTAMHSLIWTEMRAEVMDMIDQGCFNMGTLLSTVLINDMVGDELLYNLAVTDMMKFDQVYQMVVGFPPAPLMPLPSKVFDIRMNSNAAIANAITTFYTLAEIEDVIQILSGTLQDNVFLGLDFCTLISNIASCGYNNDWYDFVYEEVDNAKVLNIIIQGSEPTFLASVLFDKDRKALNKIADLQPDLISDALRITENLDVMTYLMYIYQRFGLAVFNEVLDDLGGEIDILKTLTLDELHIYGSSRHGIHKPKKLVVRKYFVLDEIQSNGIFNYGAAQDSTIAKASTKFFKRTVTYKQYELSNHLGNVLATVLDRKTAIAVSGNVKYYDADVSTAQMYYAFGSVMSQLTYVHDTGEYRYGFNGQEDEDDLFGEGDAQAYEYRISNSRLGRFFSADPIEAMYPYYSPYQFAGNTPIWAMELEGLEPSYTTGDYTDYSGGRRYNLSDGSSVTIDLSNSQEYIIIDPDGKVTEYAHSDGTTVTVYRWNEDQKGYYSDDCFDNATSVEFNPVTKSVSRERPWSFSKWEYELTSPNGEYVRFGQLPGKIIAGANPLVSGSNLWKYYFGDGKDIYNEEQSKLQVGFEWGSVVAPFIKPILALTKSADVVVKTSKAVTTVLGKYPGYINLAKKLDANYFNIPIDIWKKMSPTEQWAKNLEFLTNCIARGDNFVLSTKVSDINTVTGAFRKELDVLVANGYRLSSDGMQMIK